MENALDFVCLFIWHGVPLADFIVAELYPSLFITPVGLALYITMQCSKNSIRFNAAHFLYNVSVSVTKICDLVN